MRVQRKKLVPSKLLPPRILDRGGSQRDLPRCRFKQQYFREPGVRITKSSLHSVEGTPIFESVVSSPQEGVLPNQIAVELRWDYCSSTSTHRVSQNT